MAMEIRDVLIDGIEQLADWTDGGIKDLSKEQVNWLPVGKTVSIGFNAWHIFRTADNITNFVCRKQPTIWMEKGFMERMGLPKVDQGTGMAMEDARAVVINDLGTLREYGSAVLKDCAAYLKTVPEAVLNEVQMIRPLGEMAKWRVFRQVVMTHGFMHLGEINAIKGQQGLGFFL
jgi:hypothetical protein